MKGDLSGKFSTTCVTQVIIYFISAQLDFDLEFEEHRWKCERAFGSDIAFDGVVADEKSLFAFHFFISRSKRERGKWEENRLGKPAGKIFSHVLSESNSLFVIRRLEGAHQIKFTYMSQRQIYDVKDVKTFLALDFFLPSEKSTASEIKIVARIQKIFHPPAHHRRSRRRRSSRGKALE